MDATLERRLERLKHYATRYELVAAHPDGRRMLVAYTSNRSRRGLDGAITGRVERARALVAVCGAERFTFADRAAAGAILGDWRIVFSGRTQREAILSGAELPYVEDVAAQATQAAQ